MVQTKCFQMILSMKASEIPPRQINHEKMPTFPASYPINTVPTAISEKNSHATVRNDGLS